MFVLFTLYQFARNHLVLCPLAQTQTRNRRKPPGREFFQRIDMCFFFSISVCTGSMVARLKPPIIQLNEFESVLVWKLRSMHCCTRLRCRRCHICLSVFKKLLTLYCLICLLAFLLCFLPVPLFVLLIGRGVMGKPQVIACSARMRKQKKKTPAAAVLGFVMVIGFSINSMYVSCRAIVSYVTVSSS